MSFGPTNIVNRANTDMTAIELLIQARYTPSVERMNAIAKIAADYVANAQAGGFGYMVKPEYRELS